MMNILKIIHFKKIASRAILVLLILVLSISVVSVIPPSSASAEGTEAVCDQLFYGTNDVLFYNPCDSTCSNSPSETMISGADNAEKIWNYYIGKSLTPVAVAGIMGNFSQESTFDPAVKQNNTLAALPLGGDGVTGYGLAQWTYQARQAMLFAKIDAAGLSKYLGEGWGAHEVNKEIPPADLDKLLEVELDFSWDGDSTKISSIADQLNATTSVAGNDGSAVIFHNLYENSSDDAGQIEERVSDATAILAKYGTKTTSSGEGCSTNTTVGGVKTIDDAVAWAKKYVEDTKKEYASTLDVSGTEMNTGTNPKFVYKFGHGSGSYCWNAADCGQCVALSGWFVSTQTTDEAFLYENGGYIVDRYEDAGLPTGADPRPFSIFSAKSSAAGHTGLVLGVMDNGDVITAEANWDSSGSVVVWQGNIKQRYAGEDLKFAYFDDRLTGDALKASHE